MSGEWWVVERIYGIEGIEGIERIDGIGSVDSIESIDSLDEFSAEHFAQLMALDPEAWRQELAAHDDWFAKLADRLPPQLAAHRSKLAAALAG